MKPWKPAPARATLALVGVCVAIQLLATLMGTGFDRAATLAAGLVPARLTGQVVGLEGAVPAPLTLVTHIFLHGGFVHLLMNMVFLLWVGRHVEWLLGPVRVLALFLVGGVAGGLAQVMATPASVIPVVGASGAVSALFATYALLFARGGEAPASVMGFRLSAELVRALRFAALFIGLQLLVAVVFNRPGGPGIAIWAHIGGFLAGLLYGLPFVWTRRGGEPRP